MGATLIIGSPVLLQAAGGDSSSDVSGGFGEAVQSSKGAIIKVPVDTAGRELTDQAEIRVYSGSVAPTDAALPAAFDTSTDGTSQPSVADADIERDSSTSGWYYDWRPGGWQYNYYYNYRPAYFYYGNYYTYGYPYYYNYYGYNPYGYYGYRYYYYPSYW